MKQAHNHHLLQNAGPFIVVAGCSHQSVASPSLWLSGLTMDILSSVLMQSKFLNFGFYCLSVWFIAKM